MTSEKELIIEKLNEASLRELDVLVARYFYNYEVKIDRVDSKNNNNIKYLYLPKRRKYTRHFSKSKTKLEKSNDNWRALPRWSSDIRDCKKLINDSIEDTGQIVLKIIDKENSEVIIRGQRFVGSLCSSVVKGILLHTLMEKEK